VKHGKGIFIADPVKKELEAFKEWLKTNETSIFEHFEVRLMIDPKAAGLAAVKAEDDDIEEMENACCNFDASFNDNNTPAMIKYDEEFHLAMARSTKNRPLYYLMKTMTSSLPEGWITSLHIPGRSEKTIEEHKAILQAIKDKDSSAAEKAVKRHLNNALADIRASLK
jgi:GntR family transcriptional regulator, transcriptional repressor for pyruvate dehydrogenase complex